MSKPNLPDGVEARFRPFAEFRAEGEDGSMTIVGHASTFSDPYDLGPFEEQVSPSAFDRAIKEDDVRALFNHDPSQVLGRTKSGTLRLAIDKVGLVSEIDLPASAVAVREAIERGDVDQMSFAFTVVKESWEERDGAKPLRTLEEVELFDVSPVTYPANANTDVALRSLEAVRAETEERSEDAEDTEDEAPTVPLAFRRRQLQVIEAEVDVDDGRGRSDMDIRDELAAAIRGSDMGAGAEWLYIEDIYQDDGFVVFRTDGGTTLQAGLYRVTYEMGEESGVTFGEAVRVRRVTTYEPVDAPEQAGAA